MKSIKIVMTILALNCGIALQADDNQAQINALKAKWEQAKQLPFLKFGGPSTETQKTLDEAMETLDNQYFLITDKLEQEGSELEKLMTLKKDTLEAYLELNPSNPVLTKRAHIAFEDVIQQAIVHADWLSNIFDKQIPHWEPQKKMVIDGINTVKKDLEAFLPAQQLRAKI